MFRAIKRLFIWMGLMAEKATETDAINQAVVERGIRDSKAKADKAHYANGQLAGQIALLRDQIKRQDRQRLELHRLHVRSGELAGLDPIDAELVQEDARAFALEGRERGRLRGHAGSSDLADHLPCRLR